MDFADEGQGITEAIIEAGIDRVRKEARTNQFPVTGTCYNPRCEDDSPTRPFCSKECRDEFDRIQVLNKRNRYA